MENSKFLNKLEKFISWGFQLVHSWSHSHLLLREEKVILQAGACWTPVEGSTVCSVLVL